MGREFIRISIHSPRVGRDDPATAPAVRTAFISIHSPRVGRDNIWAGGRRRSAYFNPLSPCGERRPLSHGSCSSGHFNPLSPYGERPAGISAGGMSMNFNPLSPYGERLCNALSLSAASIFQSPLPIRGETSLKPFICLILIISIPSPHTGRDFWPLHPIHGGVISIPSPHTGRDGGPLVSFHPYADFNPLSPYGERQRSTPRNTKRI